MPNMFFIRINMCKLKWMYCWFQVHFQREYRVYRYANTSDVFLYKGLFRTGDSPSEKKSSNIIDFTKSYGIPIENSIKLCDFQWKILLSWNLFESLTEIAKFHRKRFCKSANGSCAFMIFLYTDRVAEWNHLCGHKCTSQAYKSSSSQAKPVNNLESFTKCVTVPSNRAYEERHVLYIPLFVVMCSFDPL